MSASRIALQSCDFAFLILFPISNALEGALSFDSVEEYLKPFTKIITVAFCMVTHEVGYALTALHGAVSILTNHVTIRIMGFDGTFILISDLASFRK